MKEIFETGSYQKYYGNSGNVTKAIQDISFSVQEGNCRDHGSIRLRQDYPAQLYFHH